MKHIWILSTVYLLVASAAMICHGMTGPHQNDSGAPEPEARTEYFVVGKDANLSCGNRTLGRTSDEALHYIWKINISGVHCLISESARNAPHNNCSGGKMLRNTTKGAPFLHIPHFGHKDEGSYKCEVVYKGGADTSTITALAAVPPYLSIRKEMRDGQMFAICSAAGGRPAAKVSWMGTKASSEVKPTENKNDTFTVESWLLLPLNNGTKEESLTCVSTDSLGTRNISETVKHLSEENKWIIPVTGCTVLVIVALAVVFSYAARKHLSKFSSLVGPCCNSDVPSSTESKPPQEVEEVEPYESYVQRVNSIYNSSADLFGV